jgi:glycyl-tRNA synthetase
LSLGLNKDNLELKRFKANEIAHYSKATSDIEYKFPFGQGELMGIANRTDFDLQAHIKHSGEKMFYLDPTNNEKIIPHVIEPSVGLDRLMLALICDAFNMDEVNGEKRFYLNLTKEMAPYKAAICPLTKKQAPLAEKIFEDLIHKGYSITYDKSGSIGKRYRRQDAIGTP